MFRYRIVTGVQSCALLCFLRLFFFFFQAEDGIRDWSVTGVQTCALPISFANQPKTAFDLVGQALERLPNDPELLYDYAMLAEKIERVDILEASLRKLIEIRPEHAHAYNALGYSLADRNQRLPEARELIEKALKLAPDDSFIIDSMGWVLYRMGDLKDSLGYLRRAFAGRPDPEIAAHLGEVLWAMGERAQADRVWGEATRETPDNETLANTIKRLKR